MKAELLDQEIVMELTTSNTLEQNRALKRLHLMLMQMVLTLKLKPRLPQSFWVYSVFTTLYLRNMLPVKRIVAPCTLYKAWYKNQASCKHICTYACVMLAHALPSKT